MYCSSDELLQPSWWRNSAYSDPQSGPVAYLGPNNGSYLCRAVFNPINVRIHLLLSPLPTPNNTRTGQKSGSIWIFGELLLISSSSALVTREGKLIKTTKEASWKDNHNSKQKSDSLCFYTSNHFTSESKVLFEQFNIIFTT